MTTNEMSDLARANIDKTVRITYSNGEVDLAIVLTVDDEGFVYDLASSPTGEADSWTPFSEIEAIEPVGAENGQLQRTERIARFQPI